MNRPEDAKPRSFILDDGSVYVGVPAAEFPDGDTWDSVEVERRLAQTPGVRSLMSVTSQNGWSANDRSVIASYTIPGTKTRIALRAGDCSVLLLDFLAWWNVAIEPIDGTVLDDWGYAERTIRGSTTTLSNHASGTAADANATKHPLATHTLTKPELAMVKDRIALYRGALRHGAFYTGRVDEMHAEINAGPALVCQVADDVRAGRIGHGTTTTPIPAQQEDEDIMKSFRSDPATGGNGQIVIGAEGIWEPIPSPAHYGMLVTHELIKPFLNVSPPVFDYYGAIYLSARKDSSAPVVHGLMAPVSKVAEAARNVTEEEARAAIIDPELLAEVDRLTAEAA